MSTSSNDNPIPIYLINLCHICNKDFRFSSGLRRHRSTFQQTPLTARLKTGNFDLTGKILSKKGVPSTAIPCYTCPSCWSYSSDISWIKTHVPTHKLNQQDEENIIPIETSKATFHFRDATSFLHAPKRPKITTESIANLSPIVTFVSASNATLAPVLKENVNQHLIDQSNLVCLKSYPVSHSFLKQALDIELNALTRFLWTFREPEEIKADDAILLRTIQFILTDFCNKCNRNPYYQPKYEISYWIDRVVPIFQTFGDQSGLLGYQWCEVPTEEHAEFIIDPSTWMKTSSTKYHDGVGYDLGGTSRLVMEGSSNDVVKENVDHTQDDTIKILHASIENLTSFLRRHSTASFPSLCSVVTYSLQCVCTSITLSTTVLDPDNIGSYIHEEKRSAHIPLTFDKRFTWMQVFELVTFLFSSLRDQEAILERIMKESSGIIEVEDDDRGIHVLSEIADTI